MSFDKLLGDLSRGLRRRDIQSGTPRRLEASILAGLPDFPATGGSQPVASGFTGGLVAVCVAGVGIVALARQVLPTTMATPAPAVVPHVESPVSRETAKIRAAVDVQNTWHLSETRSLGSGRAHADVRSSWEEWGRRSPYFYRTEAFGESIIDDGKTIVHVIPERRIAAASSGVGRAVVIPGRIVIRRSDGPLFRSEDHSGILTTNPEKLKYPPTPPGVSVGGSSGFGIASSEQLIYSPHAPTKSSETVTIQKVQQFKGILGYADAEVSERLVENQSSHLPSSDSSVWTKTNLGGTKGTGKEQEAQTEIIRADYGRALPSSVTTLKAIPGYSVIDLREINPPRAAGAGRDANAVDLSLRPEVLTEAGDEIYTLRLNTDFGAKPSVKDALSVTLQNFSAKDYAGNVFVSIAAKMSDSHAATLTITPVDPDTTSRSHTRNVVVECDAIIKGQDPFSKLDGGPDSKVHLVRVVRLGAIPLQSAATDASIASDLRSPATIVTLEEIAVARASYYAPGPLNVAANGVEDNLRAFSPPPPPETNGPVRAAAMRPNDAARASYWWGVAAGEAERAGKTGAVRQYRSRERMLAPR